MWKRPGGVGTKARFSTGFAPWPCVRERWYDRCAKETPRASRGSPFVSPLLPSSPGTLQYGLVRNIAPTRWIWQGQTHSLFEVRKERVLPTLHDIWRKTFGDAHPSALEFMEGYLIGEAWDQPYVQFQPWVFAPTAPGWSTLVEGFHRTPAYDGMRAVIATDWFSSMAMVYRLYDSSTATIPFRAPMLRAIPVPRSALELGIRESTLE